MTSQIPSPDRIRTRHADDPGIYRVQVLDRALDILDCFDFQDRELGLTQISRKAGLNMSTTKRLVANLAGRGYLYQDPDSRHYRLGIRLFELGGVVLSSFSINRAAAPALTRIEKETGLTVLLGTNIDNQLVYIDKRKGSGMIHISSEIGWRRPLHYGMLGMVLMAFSSVELQRRIILTSPLEAHTPHSITDANAFSLRLEEIRRDGYVVEREEAVEGIIGVAAPIRDHTRKVTAALGVAMPLSRGTAREIQRTVGLLLDTSREISESLGYMKI